MYIVEPLLLPMSWNSESLFKCFLSLRILDIFSCSGVPALVDFAAMRDTVKRLGGDPAKINPIAPADLVIDHSVQVDVFRRLEHQYVP